MSMLTHQVHHFLVAHFPVKKEEAHRAHQNAHCFTEIKGSFVIQRRTGKI
jgi:hypothetical protein